MYTVLLGPVVLQTLNHEGSGWGDRDIIQIAVVTATTLSGVYGPLVEHICVFSSISLY
jgi:hypothetical protein